jgi:hypothetical protein
MISVPALAQTQGQAGRAPQATTAAPVETPTTSDTTTDANAIPAAQAPTAATDAQAAASTATPAASATPAANATATAQPATSATQIAQVVNTEFPSYDKDANGGLNKAEFASWMVALKTASDPATKATDPATQTWVGNAFTQADKDKSAALTKDEVTAFLSQGAE